MACGATVIALAAWGGGCGSTSAKAPQRASFVMPARHGITVSELEHAVRTNPNNEASHVACRRLRHPPRHSPLSPPPTFTCHIAFGHEHPATYDVQIVSGRCFVAERRRPGRADYGCIRR